MFNLHDSLIRQITMKTKSRLSERILKILFVKQNLSVQNVLNTSVSKQRDEHLMTNFDLNCFSDTLRIIKICIIL